MKSDFPIVEIKRANALRTRYTKCQTVLTILDFPTGQWRIGESNHWIIPECLLSVDTPLVITMDPSRCLLLFPQDEWHLISDKVLRLQSSVPGVDAIKRLVVGSARDERIHKNHCLSIAPELIRFAKLDNTAYWVQAKDHVELWNPDSFRDAESGSWLSKQNA
jgi:DNA-binding transcriptional regulator/RsmH inhibitor MraZ